MEGCRDWSCSEPHGLLSCGDMSACVNSIQDSREIPSLGIAPAFLTNVLVVGGLLLGISLEGGMQVVEVSVGIAGEKWACSTEILTELPQLPVWHWP